MTRSGGASVETVGCLISVTVSPRSSRNRIELSDNDEIRVRVTAPPVDGAANAMVLRLLADALEVPRSALEIVAGETGRRKRVAVTGLDVPQITDRLRRATKRDH